jgi:hypothetical protein
MPRKLLLCCAFLALTTAVLPAISFAGPKQLVDSRDYKDKDFKQCVIADYADMVAGDDVEWLWTNPAQKLAEYKLKVGKVENKSEIRSKSMVESVKSTFSDVFADQAAKGATGTLTADLCIYEAQNMNSAKAWIPFVGLHQMQAAIGIEMVLLDEHDKPVAKFRHFAREGGQIEAATQEVVSDMMKYIAKH